MVDQEHFPTMATPKFSAFVYVKKGFIIVLNFLFELFLLLNYFKLGPPPL